MDNVLKARMTLSLLLLFILLLKCCQILGDQAVNHVLHYTKQAQHLWNFTKFSLPVLHCQAAFRLTSLRSTCLLNCGFVSHASEANFPNLQ